MILRDVLPAVLFLSVICLQGVGMYTKFGGNPPVVTVVEPATKKEQAGGRVCSVRIENFCVSDRGIHYFAPSSSLVKNMNVAGISTKLPFEHMVLIGMGFLAIPLTTTTQSRVIATTLLAVVVTMIVNAGQPTEAKPVRPAPTTTAAKPTDFPYCQEMSGKDPPFKSFRDTSPPYLSEFKDTPVYLYPATPFWLTPWHLWLSTIIAYDATSRFNLQEADVFIQWYQGRYRFMPAFVPTLNPEAVGGPRYQMAGLLTCLGKNVLGLPEVKTRRCYKTGYLGSPLWGEGLPAATVNNSYGSHFDKNLVRNWMTKVGGCLEWDLAEALNRGCASKAVRTSIIQRKEGRLILNENEVVTRMKATGWEVGVVHPEDLALQEQLELFTSSDVMVSVFGSGLSWLPFMRKGTVALAIIPTKGAGGDKYNQGLNGPTDPVNLNTAFGTWAQHINYYTATSGHVPDPPGKRLKWKDQNVTLPNELLDQFIDATWKHMQGAKRCQAW